MCSKVLLLGPFWGSLGCHFGALKASCLCWGPQGDPRCHFGCIWGPFWAPLGLLWGSFGAPLGLLWVLLGSFGTPLAPLWVLLGLLWVSFGPPRGPLGLQGAPWGHPGALSNLSGLPRDTNLAEMDPSCIFEFLSASLDTCLPFFLEAQMNLRLI